MKKRSMAYLLAIAALSLLTVPLSGHAGLVPHIIEADCEDTTTAGGNGVCTTTFEFDQAGFVSNIDTHGNFHAPLTPGGAVKLQWFDPTGALVFEANCLAAGLSIDGVGPLDVQSLTCANDTPEPREAVEGTQTLVVTASGAASTVFHGNIAISAEDALI